MNNAEQNNKKNIKKRLSEFYKKDASQSVLSSILCILAGVLVGFIFMLIMALTSDELTFFDALKGLKVMLLGPFSSGSSANVAFNLGNMIFYSAPLIMTGLSVAVAFKTGLFNIGAPGQFFMGTLGSLLIALNIDCTGEPVKGVFVWILAVIVGMLLGIIWGCIPGIFKAFLNVNEVIVCIMTNWIAANILSWVFSNESCRHLVNAAGGKSGYLITTGAKGTGTPTLGLEKILTKSYIDISVFIAVIFAVLVYIMLQKTTFGYELKACGNNRDAARYAGMNEKRNIVLSMAIAGGLAAVAGAFFYLNPNSEFAFKAAYQKLPDYGFNGIPVALLASNNPIGVVFSGIFLRFLNQGGANLNLAGYSEYIANIVIALIIYFSAFARLFRDIMVRRKKSKKGE